VNVNFKTVSGNKAKLTGIEINSIPAHYGEQVETRKIDAANTSELNKLAKELKSAKLTKSRDGYLIDEAIDLVSGKTVSVPQTIVNTVKSVKLQENSNNVVIRRTGKLIDGYQDISVFYESSAGNNVKLKKINILSVPGQNPQAGKNEVINPGDKEKVAKLAFELGMMVFDRQPSDEVWKESNKLRGAEDLLDDGQTLAVNIGIGI
jgi:hypothetical protein